MAEVHVLGTLEGASGFPPSSLYCRYAFVTKGGNWSLAAGSAAGQTQTVEAARDGVDPSVWSHPIDVHLSCTTLAGWPQLAVEVFAQDSYGRNEIAGYGTAYVPVSAGPHSLTISCWRPTAESVVGRASEVLLGAYPTLADPSLITHAGDRSSLFAVSTGVVHVELNIILRGFDTKGVTL